MQTEQVRRGVQKKAVVITRGSNEQLRLGIREREGGQVVDIRIYVQDANGEWSPSPKGVSVSLDQWPAFVDAIFRVGDELELKGLISQEGEDG